MEEILKQIETELNDNNFEFKVAVPFKFHYLNYNENQSLNGIIKKFSVLNLSSGDSYVCRLDLRNDFFEDSKIDFSLTKFVISQESNKQIKKELPNLFISKSDECLKIFETLKKQFYDIHVKNPVPPKY
jgi:hypothetical protein